MTERADEREAEGVGPHVETAKTDAEEGAQLGPQWLGVSHPPQIAANVRGPPSIVVVRKFVIGATGSNCRGDSLRGKHSGQHRVVRALDARDVDEARRATDQ